MLCCRIAHAYWWSSTDVQCTHSLILDKICKRVTHAYGSSSHSPTWTPVGRCTLLPGEPGEQGTNVHTQLYYTCPHLILFVPPQYEHLCGLGVPGIQGKTIQRCNMLCVTHSFSTSSYVRMNTIGVPSGSRSERWDHSQITTHSLRNIFQ